jgi:hypothetical protein
MLSLCIWVFRKGKNQPESLLKLLIAAKKVEDDRNLASICFRAGYRVGQMYPNKPLDPEG